MEGGPTKLRLEGPLKWTSASWHLFSIHLPVKRLKIIDLKISKIFLCTSASCYVGESTSASCPICEMSVSVNYAQHYLKLTPLIESLFLGTCFKKSKGYLAPIKKINSGLPPVFYMLLNKTMQKDFKIFGKKILEYTSRTIYSNTFNETNNEMELHWLSSHPNASSVQIVPRWAIINQLIR